MLRSFSVKMLTDQQKTAFKRDSFALIKKLDCKTKFLALNEWVTIHPTGYGWRNAARNFVIDDKTHSFIDRHWRGSRYSTGGIIGSINYLFTGDSLTIITIVNDCDYTCINYDSIYDTIDLSDFLNTPFTDIEIREYIRSACAIVEDLLKNKSSLIKEMYYDGRIFTLKQKKFCSIISSYLIPMFCYLDSSFSPTKEIIKTGLYIQHNRIYMINEVINNLVLNGEIFPFLKENGALFRGFTSHNVGNPTIIN